MSIEVTCCRADGLVTDLGAQHLATQWSAIDS